MHMHRSLVPRQTEHSLAEQWQRFIGTRQLEHVGVPTDTDVVGSAPLSFSLPACSLGATDSDSTGADVTALGNDIRGGTRRRRFVGRRFGGFETKREHSQLWELRVDDGMHCRGGSAFIPSTNHTSEPSELCFGRLAPFASGVGRRHGRGRGPAGRTILSRFDCESCTDCRRHRGLLQEEAQEEEEEEVRHEVTGLQCFDSGRGDH